MKEEEGEGGETKKKRPSARTRAIPRSISAVELARSAPAWKKSGRLSATRCNRDWTSEALRESRFGTAAAAAVQVSSRLDN